MQGQSDAVCTPVLWNGTTFLPWGWGENSKFILFRTTNPSRPTWNTHFKAKGPCRHQSLTDNRSSETSSSFIKPKPIHPCDVSLGRLGTRFLFFLAGRKCVSKLWLDIYPQNVYGFNLKWLNSFSWERNKSWRQWYGAGPLLYSYLAQHLVFKL